MALLRSLCGTPWDAEDVLQESLAKAYSKLPLLWQAVDLPSYLRGIARNCWADWVCRNGFRALEGEPAEVEESISDTVGELVEVRSMFQQVLNDLSPRQAAAVLYSLLGFSGREIASKLRMTPGSVRTELSRARSKLSQGGSERPVADAALLERFVAAYNARDVEQLSSLLDEHVRAKIVGVAEEAGRQTVLENSIADDFGRPALHAEVCRLFDREIVAVKEGGELVQVMLLTPESGRVGEIRTYHFCPELLEEVGARLSLPARNNGYRLPA